MEVWNKILNTDRLPDDVYQDRVSTVVPKHIIGLG